MNKPFAFLFLAVFMVLFTACGSSADTDSGATLTLRPTEYGSGGVLATGPGGAASPSALTSPVELFTGASGSASSMPAFTGGVTGSMQQGASRGPVSLASVAVAVESVEGAALQVQAIAESLGGLVERLSSSGSGDSLRSDIIVKVPQARFSQAMGRIEALGDVQARSLASEDVTEQHIDLTARLGVYRKEEQSLLSLMERSSSVSDLLSVERELARVRANIERSQGQLDLLLQRLDLATIHVALFSEGTLASSGTAATFTVGVVSVVDRVAELRKYVTDRGGEIEGVYLASFEDDERAEVSFQVADRDFNRATRFIEDQGRVESRELLERISPSADSRGQGGQPKARIHVTYVGRSTSVGAWIPIVIIVGLVIAGVSATYLMRLAYRRGRRRGSFM